MSDHSAIVPDRFPAERGGGLDGNRAEHRHPRVPMDLRRRGCTHCEVFAAPPDHVVDLGDKCKAGPTVRVVYCGTWYGALSVVRDGQRRWIEHAASGAASATGWSGAASATGWSGAASATGESGTLEVGPGGIASCTASLCYWRVRDGAVFVQTWKDNNDEWQWALYESADFTDGVLVEIICGKAKVVA